jgi:hypothetical protein
MTQEPDGSAFGNAIVSLKQCAGSQRKRDHVQPPRPKIRQGVRRSVDDKVCDEVRDEMWELDVIPDRMPFW